MICRICYNEKNNRAYEVKEMMFGHRDIFRYILCSQCQCLQIEEAPQNMSKYYPQNYYSYSAPEIHRNKKSKFSTRVINNYAVWKRGLVGKLLYAYSPNTTLRTLHSPAVTKDSRILDVGCGAGVLLNSLRELGMRNLLGIDPYINEDIKYENGLIIQKKKIEDINEKWNVVMFHHSFEHFPDPLKTLQTVIELLTPDGHCIIRIPIVPSYAWEHYGVNWVQLDAPRHLFLHSVRSMSILAEQSGLKLRDVVYDSTAFQFWGSEQYVKDIPLRDKRSYSENPDAAMFSKSEISSFADRAKKLNAAKQGDQAVFYFGKP